MSTVHYCEHGFMQCCPTCNAEIARIRAEVKRLATERDQALGKEADAKAALDSRDYIQWRAAYDSELSKRIEVLNQERNEALAQVAALRHCRTCGGIPPISGRVCICGGTNLVDQEIEGLRAECYTLQRRLERAEQVAEAFKRCLEELHFNGGCDPTCEELFHKPLTAWQEARDAH